MEKTKKINQPDNNESGFFAKMKNYFKSLGIVTAMQFKDQIDFSFLKSKKKTLFKFVYSLLLFVAITMIIKIIFDLIVQLGLFSFVQVLNFRVYLVLMSVLLLLAFLACVTKVTKTLYFSKDNPVLVTMPVSNSMIFTSKLIVCFIYELIKNINYILPFMFAYGLSLGLPFLYFVYSVLTLVFFVLFSVVVSGLLSIPAMMIAIILKKNKVLEYILVAGVIAVSVWALVKIIGIIPQDIDLVRDWGKIYWNIQDFLLVFSKNFIVFDYILQFLTGTKYNASSFAPFTTENLITFEIGLGIIVVSLVLIYLLCKPLFLKMISSPFEYKKSTKVKTKNSNKLPAFISATNQEIKKSVRTPNIIYTLLAVAVLTPIAIYLQNKIIGAMDTRMFGNNLCLMFNILIILLMSLSTNSMMASVYSREGNSAYLNKINPVKYYIPLSAKLMVNSIINIISIIVSCYIVYLYSVLSVMDIVLIALAIIFVYLAHLLWSAEMDIMNPQNSHYQTTGEHNKNPNEAKSTIFAFFTAFIFAFAAFTFLQESLASVGPKLILISLLYFGLRVYLYFTRVKLYYKEK